MSQQKYNFALFDWDGCLCDTLTTAKSIILELAARNSVSLSETELREIYGEWEKAAQVSKFDSVDDYKVAYTALARERQFDVKLNPGAEGVLRHLKSRNISVGIVTSSSSLQIGTLLKQLKIEHLVEAIIGYEDVIHTKPHPEPIEKMLALLDAVRELSVMIGDTEKDVLSANAAQVDSIWYTPQFNRDFYGETPHLAQLATYTIENFAELENFF